MNKAELVKAVAEKTGISAGNVKPTIDATIDVIIQAVAAGGQVRLPDFGTFKRIRQEARKGMNPATKEKIDIPARNVMKFKPGSFVVEAMG